MKLAISLLVLVSAFCVKNVVAAEVTADVLNNQSFVQESSNATPLTMDFNALDTETFRGRHGGWHGGHGGHGPIFSPRPIPRFPTTCFAKNGRGIVFRVRGFASSWRIQNEAIRFCRNNSYRPNSCRALGCR